ncbi:hypothetical protein Pmani_026057 [Petrolisthes manimaculis]|uniref:Uncharacterized protein n=1 Tax=Petrolisthes manimaculis TaxID=1843537 RepID=A0AAE1P6Y5_9EUCA|nr:hypothetical protein Pmani_026057 [Petrolisthes manimaculis]
MLQPGEDCSCIRCSELCYVNKACYSDLNNAHRVGKDRKEIMKLMMMTEGAKCQSRECQEGEEKALEGEDQTLEGQEQVLEGEESLGEAGISLGGAGESLGGGEESLVGERTDVERQPKYPCVTQQQLR